MMERVFGFEILPAPFVVAHLQLGLLLANLGAPMATEERAGVYLTNALTGWKPLTDAKRGIMAKLRINQPEFAAESDAAQEVKGNEKILVILGNPPYNGYAGVAIGEERDLSDAYRSTKRAPAPQGQGLNELYVRFFRMAERKIVEHIGRGVVCYISNYSWLDGLSHTGMRERYLDVFDRIWIDNLHGDRIISEYAPDGQTSETVFAVRGNSPGIKIGTSIQTFVRKTQMAPGAAELLYRDLHEARADERRTRLLESIEDAPFNKHYRVLQPVAPIGLPFKPAVVGGYYLDWPKLPALFPVSFPGVKTSRDNALVDIDRTALLTRMRAYFDGSVPDKEIRRSASALMEKTSEFDPVKTRNELMKRGIIEENIVRYCYRPLDLRWLYWEEETKLLDRNRPEYFPQVFGGNRALVTQQKPRRDWSCPQVIGAIGCLDLMDRGATCIPLYLKHAVMQSTPSEPEPNLSPDAAKYLAAIDMPAEDLFHHAVAVLHSRAYREENAGALRQDWPRLPLPANPRQLALSAALGRKVASLLDPEAAVPGATTGSVPEPLRSIAVVTRVDGKPIDPTAGDLALTAGWGHAGKNGVTMPGKGKVEVRTTTVIPAEAGIQRSSKQLDSRLRGNDNLKGGNDNLKDGALGTKTYDIYLNAATYWKNIPEAVWDYTIGGYQVIKKWLSYRDRDLLDRDLTLDEVRYVSEMARRIAAILLLADELDANYRAVADGDIRVEGECMSASLKAGRRGRAKTWRRSPG